jgi:hypothetical protein
MPKYYFDVNGAGVPDHDEGDMLENNDAACMRQRSLQESYSKKSTAN